jgi:hypothetical protein
VTGQQLRALALALPGVEERETWGHPTFRVRDKLFVGMAADGSTSTVRATRDEQAALVSSRPDVFAVADYVGRYGWVQVQLAHIDADEMEELVVEAWRRTAPKRAVAVFDARSAGGASGRVSG